MTDCPPPIEVISLAARAYPPFFSSPLAAGKTLFATLHLFLSDKCCVTTRGEPMFFLSSPPSLSFFPPLFFPRLANSFSCTQALSGVGGSSPQARSLPFFSPLSRQSAAFFSSSRSSVVILSHGIVLPPSFRTQMVRLDTSSGGHFFPPPGIDGCFSPPSSFPISSSE